MPIYESLFKIGKDIGENRHLTEVRVYSSPYGGYLKVCEMSRFDHGKANEMASVLMSANECRAIASALEAMACVLDENEKSGDLADAKNC
ncbi:hypothetical protein [Aeromonas caviae]|uniref:hypothetical protein n=1 Tax=Aeromonas caviae TaxID=648 RepID=UPI002B4654F8|nr:hypothetical protein [Aeromonas caviae]